MVRKKDDSKEQRLYAATLDLVGQVGLAGLTVAGIAKAAGMSTGSVYTYHANKEDLINALYKQTLRVYGERLFRDLQPGAPLKISLRLIFANYLNYLLEYRNEWVFQDQYLVSPYVVHNTDTIQYTRTMLAPLVQLLEQGQREQLVKNVPVHFFLLLLMGFGDELALAVHAQTQALTPEYVDTAFGLFWDALKA